MIWVGNTFYPGTGADWNLPIEIQNPPAYAMQSDKSQYILESTGLEGYRGYGRAPLGWRNFSVLGTSGVRGLRGNVALRGMRGNIAMRRGVRGNIALRGYGMDIYSASGVPAKLSCDTTPCGRFRCQPSYTWDEYANRIQL